jgi:CRISPR/Cas system-associated exonuclease Cas4 (RecB family)
MTLVDEALARLIEDDLQSAQDFLAGLTPAERADLRSQAVALVAAFQECFPTLKPVWIPVTESRVRVELCGGRIVLSGKTDLTLGRAAGTTANKVIIDLKSGRPALSHRDDLRFYALLETIKLGVPPRKVATYYLETGRPHPEEVSEPLLHAAVRRTVDGVQKIVELRCGERTPAKVPGPACRWCPVREDCDVGQAELARRDDEDGGAW